MEKCGNTERDKKHRTNRREYTGRKIKQAKRRRNEIRFLVFEIVMVMSVVFHACKAKMINDNACRI